MASFCENVTWDNDKHSLAHDTGAPRGCHVTPFSGPNSGQYPRLRPSSAATGPLGPEERVSEGSRRVSAVDFPEGSRGMDGEWRG